MGFSIGLWKAIWSKDKIIGFHENIYFFFLIDKQPNILERLKSHKYTGSILNSPTQG